MARPRVQAHGGRDSCRSSIERSTYVVLSSAVLLLLYWQWRTIAGRSIWDVQLPAARVVLWALFWLGWVIGVGRRRS